jgi:hypothetical protein
MVLSIALCVWGSIGWRRAYRAQAEADHLMSAEQFRDVQLLKIVVRGGEAAAQMALERESGVAPAVAPTEWGAPVPLASWGDVFGDPE